MDFIYAQLDKNNICHSVTYLAGEIEGDNIIPLKSNEIDVIGKLYRDGEWFDVENDN